MDYKVIFNDLNKIKNILNELLKSNMSSDIQTILNNLKNDSFKKVIGIQYIYLYSKTLNILHSNKSIKIVTLEENLKLIENKKINEVIGLLNKLGYVDLLLVLLNVSKDIFTNIKTYINKKKEIIIKENTLDVSKLDCIKNRDRFIDIIADKISEKILISSDKYTDININNKIDKIQNVKMPIVEDEDDSINTSDVDDEDEEFNSNEYKVKKEMKDLKMNVLNNNILNTYEKEEVNETSDTKEKKISNIELNNNDMKLLDLLD